MAKSSGLLRFEQAALGGGVVLEGVVAVEMVLGDVQRQGDVGAEVGDGFELEAGKLQHVPAVLARALDHGA